RQQQLHRWALRTSTGRQRHGILHTVPAAIRDRGTRPLSRSTSAMSPHTRKAILVGIATGLFSGLTGVGGGALVVSLIVSALGLDQRLAQGTAPAVIIPVAFFGAATYAAQGLSGQFPFDAALALRLIPALAIPSIFGVVVGATWMTALPAAHLRRA